MRGSIKYFENEAGVKLLTPISRRAVASSYCHFQIIPIDDV